MYGTRTYGELDALVADLPVSASARAVRVGVPRSVGATRRSRTSARGSRDACRRSEAFHRGDRRSEARRPGRTRRRAARGPSPRDRGGVPSRRACALGCLCRAPLAAAAVQGRLGHLKPGERQARSWGPQPDHLAPSRDRVVPTCAAPLAARSRRLGPFVAFPLGTNRHLRRKRTSLRRRCKSHSSGPPTGLGLVP